MFARIALLTALIITACATTSNNQNQQSSTKVSQPTASITELPPSVGPVDTTISEETTSVPAVPTCTDENCEFGPYSYGSKDYIFPSGGSNSVSLGYMGNYPSDEIRDIFAQINARKYGNDRMSWRLVDRTDLHALQALCTSHPEAQQHEGCQCAWTMENADNCHRVIGNMVFTLQPMGNTNQQSLSDCNGSSLPPGINAMVTDSLCGLVLVADVLPSAVEEQCQPHKVAFDGPPGERLEPEEGGREDYRFYHNGGKYFACTTAPPGSWNETEWGGGISGCRLLYSNCAELCRGLDGKFMWP